MLVLNKKYISLFCDWLKCCVSLSQLACRTLLENEFERDYIYRVYQIFLNEYWLVIGYAHTHT